ncbi:hypothetical protein ACIQ7S_03475 [Streptomyces griseoluteus]|uniref:hypothetical protein n=1 Tax=Streptomyces griseoluteus TaxID=29306 RepID=UPI00331AE056
MANSAVTKYQVTHRDGSTAVIEAARHKFEERGVLFEGRKHRQNDFVAFVHYDDLRRFETLD